MDNDHANIVVIPPLPYMLTLVGGIILYLLWEPWRFFPEPWMGHAVGWPVVASALLLVILAIRTMSHAGEDVSVHEPTHTIVSTGPYAFSRNPMYLSLALVYGGIALMVNTVWPVAFLPGVLIFIHYGVIIREESYLERKFGQDYRHYKARVRRWL